MKIRPRELCCLTCSTVFGPEYAVVDRTLKNIPKIQGYSEKNDTRHFFVWNSRQTGGPSKHELKNKCCNNASKRLGGRPTLQG